MMNKIMNNKNIDQVFKDFIINALKYEAIKENTYIGANYAENEYRSIDSDIFDIYIPNGLTILRTKGTNTYIKIKYTNDIFKFYKYVDNFDDLFFKKRDYVLCLIYIGDSREGNIEFDRHNIKVFGYEFVNNLSKRYQALWWRFLSFVDKNAKVEFDIRERRYKLNAEDKTLQMMNKNASISGGQINSINEANKADFIRKCNPADLAMIIGNGISMAFGSDSWKNMIERILDYLKPFYADDIKRISNVLGDSLYASASFAKNCLPNEKFFSAVYSSIYRKYDKKTMHEENTLIRAIVNAKNKFNEIKLYTYNYDCFIENDYEIKTGKKLNSIKSIKDFNDVNEPKITHLHGFLGETSKKLPTDFILTDEDYFMSYLDKTSNVRCFFKNILKTKKCLFVGSSITDIFQISIINETKKEINEWQCFALMCLNNLSEKDMLLLLNYYYSMGVTIIYDDDFKKLPNTLKKLIDGISNEFTYSRDSLVKQ